MIRTVFTRCSLSRRLFILNRSRNTLKIQTRFQRTHLQWKKLPLITNINNFSLKIARYYADYPSHKIVNFPSLSPTMETGKITNWLKKEGDKVAEGDLVVEIETDKATLAMESADEGYLAKIILPTGAVAPVGVPLCIMVEDEKDVAAFKDYKADIPAVAPPAPAPTAPPPAAAPATPPAAPPTPSAAPPPSSKAPGDRVYASPMAKRLAEERKIRLEGRGTGMFGSITSKDLDTLLGKRPAAVSVPSPGTLPPIPTGIPPLSLPSVPTAPVSTPGATYVDIPLTGIRATIAKRLLESKTTIPHYYLKMTCNVENLMKMRTNYNKKSEKTGIRVSVNDFMIKACAYACTKVPEVNSAWMGNAIRQYKNVDVSVAVATPTGLITPIVFNAHSKGIADISKEVKDLAARAKQGKLKPNEYQGGTITISNLGMFGIDEFSAIINPPQCSILAVGTSVKQVVAGKDGFKEETFISVTLSCDHRVADGAVGAQWLQVFRGAIEDPTTMIL